MGRPLPPIRDYVIYGQPLIVGIRTRSPNWTYLSQASRPLFYSNEIPPELEVSVVFQSGWRLHKPLFILKYAKRSLSITFGGEIRTIGRSWCASLPVRSLCSAFALNLKNALKSKTVWMEVRHLSEAIEPLLNWKLRVGLGATAFMLEFFVLICTFVLSKPSFNSYR